MIFFKNAKIVIWVPEGCRGAPGDPAESPAGPSDDLQMATMYEKIHEKSGILQDWCQIGVKTMQN